MPAAAGGGGLGPVKATWGGSHRKAAVSSRGGPIRLLVGRDTRPEFCIAARDINVIALVKGGERYVFLYDDDSSDEALRTIARHAANPELSFSWYDAAVLGQKIRHSAPRPRRLRFQPRADRRA